MKSPENHDYMWSEADNFIPDIDRCWELVDMGEIENSLIEAEETDAFFRKVRKEEKRRLKEYADFLSSPENPEDK